MGVDEFVKTFNKMYGRYSKATKYPNEIKIECYNNGEILTFPTSPVFEFDGEKHRMKIPTFVLDNLPVLGIIPLYFPSYAFCNDEEKLMEFHQITDIPLEMFYWIRDFSINIMEINQYRYTIGIIDCEFNQVAFFGNFLLRIKINKHLQCDDGLPDMKKICLELGKKEYQNDILQSDEPFSKILSLLWKLDGKSE